MSEQPSITRERFILLMLITSLLAITIDAIIPAFGTIQGRFSITAPNTLQLLISLFILGVTLGEIVFGPLADAHGRRATITVGLAVYIAGSLLAALANTYEMLLAGRFIQGFGVAGTKIGTRALIRDLVKGAEMARIISHLFSILLILPMVAPAIGQAIIAVSDWRMIFTIYIVIGGALTLWLLLRLPETLPHEHRTPLNARALARNVITICGNRQVMAYAICSGLLFGAHLAFLAMSHGLIVGLYDQGRLFSLYYAILALGIAVGSLTNARLVMRFGMLRLFRHALIGITLLGALFTGLVQAAGGVPAFPVFLGMCTVTFGLFGIAFGNVNALAMQPLDKTTGLGATLIATISNFIGFVMIYLVGNAYDDSLLPLALAFVATGALSLVLSWYATAGQPKQVEAGSGQG